MTHNILAAAVLAFGFAAPGYAGSGFYYDYPLSGEVPAIHYSIGGGNHPSGGNIGLGILSSTGNTYGIQYSKGVYGGSVDEEDTALELATGRIHVSYRDPVQPYDLFPETSGEKRAEYVGRILGLKQAVDLAFHGNDASFRGAANQPHPSLADVAAYLDAVIKNDLGGGLAPNGIPYCINARGWGEPFTCGELRCEKSDYTLASSCVVGIKNP